MPGSPTKSETYLCALLAAASLAGCAVTQRDLPGNEEPEHHDETGYLPSGEGAKVVSVDEPGPVGAGVTVLTLAVAIKEEGPEETVASFGEVYAFSPAFIAVHRDEPTEIQFWNLQADDEHDFMLVDPHLNVLAKIMLPPLGKTSHVFTFHEEGLFSFYCTMHLPEMSGQILVLPHQSGFPADPADGGSPARDDLRRTTSPAPGR